MSSLRCRVFSVRKNQWVRVVLSYDNLHPQVCPIDFSSAPVTVVSMVTMILTSTSYIVKTVTTVTIVTLREQVPA